MNLYPNKVAKLCIKWLLFVIKKEEIKRRIFPCFVLFLIVSFVLIHTIVWVKSNRGILTWFDASLQYRYTQSLADMMDAGDSLSEIAFYIKENVTWPPGVLLLRAFSMHVFEWQDVRLCNLVDCLALIIIIILSYYHFRKDIGNWALLISLFISTSLIYVVKEPLLDVWFAAFTLLTISVMGFYQDRRTYACAVLSGLFLGLSFLVKPAAGPLLIVPCVTFVLVALTTGRLKRITVVKHILCFFFVCLVTALPYYVYTYQIFFVHQLKQPETSTLTSNLFAGLRPLKVIRGRFLTSKLLSMECFELVFRGFAGRFNQQFFPLPACIFAFGGVVWSLLKRNTRNCFLNASFMISGQLFLMWRYMGCENYSYNRHFFPFLPFYFYYGILWVRSWRPRSLRIAGLILFLSIVLYPIAYVTADVFLIKIPISLRIGVKRKRLFGMNLPRSFNKDGFSLTTGCFYNRFYSFTSLKAHPWLWLWNVGDDLKSLQGSAPAYIAVIDHNWAPSTYLFRRKFKYGTRRVYKNDLLKETPLKAEFVLLHTRDQDLVPNSYYFFKKYKQGEYLLYSKKNINKCNIHNCY